MRTIYIVNVQMTGANGGIISFVESAFVDVRLAQEMCSKMDEAYKDDPNYMSYVAGPILLNEKKMEPSA